MGFSGPGKERLRADDPLGTKFMPGWTEMGVYFRLSELQKVKGLS